MAEHITLYEVNISDSTGIVGIKNEFNINKRRVIAENTPVPEAPSCPACGGPAVWEVGGGGRYAIHCQDCDLLASTDGEAFRFDTPEEAFCAWDHCVAAYPKEGFLGCSDKKGADHG